MLLALHRTVLTAVLALGGSAFYVLVYTMLAEAPTPQNIVIGGAAGAIPPLVGWAAVTGELGLAPLIMFLIIFLWTPPHFWALAILRRRTTTRARACRCCPWSRPSARRAVQILVYTVMLRSPFADPGRHRPARRRSTPSPRSCSAAASSSWRARLLRTHSPLAARATFLFSLLYLALLFAAMGADRAIAAI